MKIRDCPGGGFRRRNLNRKNVSAEPRRCLLHKIEQNRKILFFFLDDNGCKLLKRYFILQYRHANCFS